jgi:simple sugar transport system permease protein
MVKGAFGSRFAIEQVLVGAVPLCIIGLGLALAFRGSVWNIGAEGQFYMGALAGGAVALSVPWAIPFVIVPLSLAGGALGGAGWGWVVGEIRSRWGVNEVITSLLLNYVAIDLFAYVIRKPLRDPTGYLPQSRMVPTQAQLPVVPGLRVHAGLVVALVLVPVVAYVSNRTKWGFRSRAMGLNRDASQAMGTDVRRTTVHLMLVSGGLAGLAGIVQILGVQLRLQNGISPGFGFTAIVVALLGRNRAVGVLLAAIAVAAINVGGQAMQVSQQIPVAAVETIQALFILLLLVADRLVGLE